jgi:hypothetical protein
MSLFVVADFDSVEGREILERALEFAVCVSFVRFVRGD